MEKATKRMAAIFGVEAEDGHFYTICPKCGGEAQRWFGVYHCDCGHRFAEEFRRVIIHTPLTS